MEINLISDTVTKPSVEMIKFMNNCEVGDDVNPSTKIGRILSELINLLKVLIDYQNCQLDKNYLKSRHLFPHILILRKNPETDLKYQTNIQEQK